MLVRLIGVLALAALPASARAQDSAATAAPRALLGCYVLEPGPWAVDSMLARPYPVPAAGTRFELTAEPARPVGGPPVPGLLRAEGAMIALSGWLPPAKPGDSVYVGRPGGFAGVHLVLGAAAGGDLAGRITTFTDEPIPAPRWVSRPVRARRVACAASMRGRATARVLPNEALQLSGLHGRPTPALGSILPRPRRALMARS